MRRVAVRRAPNDGGGRNDVCLVPRRPFSQPDFSLVCRLPPALARAGPRQRLERARVRVRGGAHELVLGVRAMRPGELQARTRQRDMHRVPD